MFPLVLSAIQNTRIASLMQQDIEIDEVLLASKQKLDNLMNEKKQLDNEDDELTLQFSKISEEFVKPSVLKKKRFYCFALHFQMILKHLSH